MISVSSLKIAENYFNENRIGYCYKNKGKQLFAKKSLSRVFLLSTECKPNFELSYLPFAIRVPVHDYTGKFQHSCKETKMLPPPAVIFQGH